MQQTTYYMCANEHERKTKELSPKDSIWQDDECARKKGGGGSVYLKLFLKTTTCYGVLVNE